MIINWYGHSCFKITEQGGRLTIVTDPFAKSIGLTPPRISADIVTVSHQHHDHNNVKTLSGEPFVIDSPGEYEIQGVKITGCLSFHDQNKGKDRGENTIYLIETEKIRLCHLGDLGQKKLSDKQLEIIGEVDILMTPVGGIYTIDAAEAAQIAKQLQPSLIIPMHYKVPGLKIELEKLDKFLKEMGINGDKPIEKLNIKKKDLADKKMQVVMFKE